jgi:hypothetical protein
VGVATRFVVEWKGQRLYWKKCLGTGGKEGAGTGKGRKVRLDWGGRERLGGPNGIMKNGSIKIEVCKVISLPWENEVFSHSLWCRTVFCPAWLANGGFSLRRAFILCSLAYTVEVKPTTNAI